MQAKLNRLYAHRRMKESSAPTENNLIYGPEFWRQTF